MGFANHTPVTAFSSVAGLDSSTLILAENYDRRGATVYNESTAILYLKLGPDASTTSYTDQLLPHDYYETPYGYSGPLYGIWASTNGFARVTEIS